MGFHNLSEGATLDRPLSLVIAGAGGRGGQYADMNALLDEPARIVGVADPSPTRRDLMRARRGVAEDAEYFDDWRELAARPRMADAVIIATQDAEHLEPTMAFAKQGYDILLEKPMAVTEEECAAIEEAANKYHVSIAVCHVLRYTPYTTKLVEVLRSGAVGEIVSVDHLEPIGFDHFAHSYVRGPWRSTREAAPMLMAKSCHDIDWLSYIIDKPVVKVSSFGGLYHFRAEQKPEGAADRCVDCAVKDGCAYDATRIYTIGGPKFMLLKALDGAEPTEQGLDEALRTGPYGRCVFACDNDVADHQVVNLEYEGGTTAAFTVTAFTEMGGRKTTVYGTHGVLVGDSDSIVVTDFRTRKETAYSIGDADHSASGGHGGGDYGLIKAFVEAMTTGRPELILTDVAESLATHRVVFAAERSRTSGTVVTF